MRGSISASASPWFPKIATIRFAELTAGGSVCVAFLVHGFCLRILALSTVVDKWANANQRSLLIAAVGLFVGALEDACVCLSACISLWLGGLAFQSATAPTHVPSCRSAPPSRSSECIISRPHTLLLTAALVAIHFVVANLFLCVDLVFVRTRQMRFKWDFVQLYWRERHSEAAKQLQIDDSEWLIACQMGGITVAMAALLLWRLADPSTWRRNALAEWDIQLWRTASQCVRRSIQAIGKKRTDTNAVAGPSPQLQDDVSDDAALLKSKASIDAGDDFSQKISTCTMLSRSPNGGLVIRGFRLLMLWFVLVVTTITVTKMVPSIVAMVAWNASLCEPLRLLASVDCMATRSSHSSTKKLRDLIDTTTETCQFLSDLDTEDTLVRKTTGFHGPLAFNVSIEPNEKPNVLIVVIESFRQKDSQYLLDKQQHLDFGNISLTPQFDKWAKRGIGFRNMWSTWRTSRSLEQILFGQLPLDSATNSGTTGGRKNVKLSGLPQLFHLKGYETLFTTGSRLDYDDWDVFVPSHGFDTVLSGWDLADIAQDEMGIDWTQGDRMMAYWGFHDDLSFTVLAHLLKKRFLATKQKQGKPFFATHYTISSHVPFDERPDWFFRLVDQNELPDFSALYTSITNPEIQELVKNYAEMRYFSDLCFGAFMDELESSGVLEDTIVVVTGDHGHAPERGIAMPEEDQVGAMNVAAALIAQRRLGDDAGKILGDEDASAQYDWLNTITDIVHLEGLPDGFVQTGVGRSLKRKPAASVGPGDEDDGQGHGRRVVYSNNPALNLAAVQGHTRMEFYGDVPDVVRVYNVQHDPQCAYDLMEELPQNRVHEIQRICDDARLLNSYFTKRWEENCLLPPLCEM